MRIITLTPEKVCPSNDIYADMTYFISILLEFDLDITINHDNWALNFTADEGTADDISRRDWNGWTLKIV